MPSSQDEWTNEYAPHPARLVQKVTFLPEPAHTSLMPALFLVLAHSSWL